MRNGLHGYVEIGAKTNNYTAKQYCFTLQTILFDVPNTSVWRPKQYCFIRRSQMFGRKNTWFAFL